jgi:hypothetical protein
LSRLSVVAYKIFSFYFDPLIRQKCVVFALHRVGVVLQFMKLVREKIEMAGIGRVNPQWTGVK